MFYNYPFKQQIILISLILIICSFLSFSATEESENKGYVIDQPGTITFTSGVKIKGKVEKPQVVIFMTKEKSAARPMDFNYSFKEEIMEPIDLNPLLEDFTNSGKD